MPVPSASATTARSTDAAASRAVGEVVRPQRGEVSEQRRARHPVAGGVCADRDRGVVEPVRRRPPARSAAPGCRTACSTSAAVVGHDDDLRDRLARRRGGDRVERDRARERHAVHAGHVEPGLADAPTASPG